MAISGSFVADGTVVTAVVTGSGGVGTYRVSISQNIGSANRAKSFSAVDNTPIRLYGSGITITAKSYTLNNSSTASGRLNGVITYPSNWVGLTEGASANDIIQYGTITNTVSTEFNPSGTATLLLKDVAGVVEGAVVTFATNGGAVGTVISVDYNTKQIVIDAPITVDFPNNTQLRFTADGWVIDYENNSTGMEEYVVNSNTGIQYRNNNGIWRQSYTGYYDQGQWRVII
jgi:hypothetical protein